MSKKIVVGMSGGVDSTVAAFLLQQQGWEVVGAFMKNWEDEDDAVYRSEGPHGCTWEEDMQDVRSVCSQLGIPFMTFNFVEEYRERVFKEFVSELERGRTPNPDILCNQEIKFQLFLEKALAVPGVEAVATGHYAAMKDGQLARPKDANKDQTYFLYRMPREHLSRVVFPLAEYTKDEVRAVAEKQGFVNAKKKDSTGICFIGNIDYASFVQQYVQKKPGKIITTSGKVIGEHEGLHLFTIGQRKGIDIGGTGPYYVVEKKLDERVLVVTDNAEDPLLYQSIVTLEQVSWLTDVTLPFTGHGQIRYRQEAQPVTVEYNQAGEVVLTFTEPQRAITPGQSAVIYIDDVVVGGGVIQSAL